MNNFPFEHNGERLWYSRSIAVNACIFGKDKNGELHVLIEKRGKTVVSSPDMYCVPGGFLDFNEDLIQCVIREVYEETGLVLERQLINFWNINSIPNATRQTVTVIYYVMLPGYIEDYNLSTENMEEDEIQEVYFLPVSMMVTSDMEFAFNNKAIVLDIYNRGILKNERR